MKDPIKQSEERKRESCWDRRMRWKAIQDTITWADAQSTCRRNTPERCLKEQARILGR